MCCRGIVEVISKLDHFKFLIHNNGCGAFTICAIWMSSHMKMPFYDFSIIRLNRGNSCENEVILGIKKWHSFFILKSSHVSLYLKADICSAVPAPRLIMGAGWNCMSTTVLLYANFDMTILNNGKVSHLVGPSSNGSRLNLTLCNNPLWLDFPWDVIQDPRGSFCQWTRVAQNDLMSRWV